MSSEQPSPLLLDAVKASASKFKEQKDALEARAKELDALKAQLDSERAHLDKDAAKLESGLAAFAKDKEDVEAARAAIDRDVAGVKVERDKVSGEEKHLEDWARTLNEREKAMKDAEDRIRPLHQEFTGQIKESEGKLQELIEREVL